MNEWKYYRGVWKPAEPKYETIRKAIAWMQELGFGNLKIQTTGESSTHMWSAAFKRTYSDMGEFLEKCKKDYVRESAVASRNGGPDRDWNETCFTMDKNLENDAIRVFIWIPENDYLAFKEKPVEARWVVSVGESLEGSEIVRMLVEALEQIG